MSLPCYPTPDNPPIGPCPSTPPQGEDVVYLPAYALRDYYRRRLLSPIDVTEAYITRILRLNPDINAYIEYTFDLARTAAIESDNRYRAGGTQIRQLEGIPLSVKDLFDFIAGVRNTFGSLVFKDIIEFIPDHNAIYISYLLDAGAVPLGKVNTPEFGHKGITDNLAYGPTSTTYHLDYNAGGSSGGSAASVAGFLAAISEGSDAGGSVRIPAAMTGTVGFKMTYGRIPQDLPVMTHTPFLHPGPMARTVGDTALLADVMATPWSMDPASLPDKPRYFNNLNAGIRGKKIAFSPNLDIYPVDPEVADIVRSATNAFCRAGATVDEIPNLGYGNLTYDTDDKPFDHIKGADLWIMEQSVLYGHANDMLMHPPAPGIPGIDLREFQDMLTPEFYDMIMRGYATSAVDYRHGEFLRMNGASGINGINYVTETILNNYDYIVCPTVAVAGVPNDTNGNTLGPATVNGVPVERQIGWCLTYFYNFTGHPAISVPAGLDSQGLPVGLQIIGRRWQDGSVLRAARAVEQYRPWYHTYPRMEN